MQSKIQKLYDQIEFTKMLPNISNKAKEDLIEIYNSQIDKIQSKCKHKKHLSSKRLENSTSIRVSQLLKANTSSFM